MSDIIKDVLRDALGQATGDSRLLPHGSPIRQRADAEARVKKHKAAIAEYQDLLTRVKELEAYKRALQFGVIGWREYDWPEGFDRRTAELIAEHVEERVGRLRNTTLISVSRDAAELAVDALTIQQREDAYDSYGRAVRELRAALNKEDKTDD